MAGGMVVATTAPANTPNASPDKAIRGDMRSSSRQESTACRASLSPHAGATACQMSCARGAPDGRAALGANYCRSGYTATPPDLQLAARYMARAEADHRRPPPRTTDPRG